MSGTKFKEILAAERRHSKKPQPRIEFPDPPAPKPCPLAVAAKQYCPELAELYRTPILQAHLETAIMRLVLIGRMRLKGRLSDD